jgi:hypothetical protein
MFTINDARFTDPSKKAQMEKELQRTAAYMNRMESLQESLRAQVPTRSAAPKVEWQDFEGIQVLRKGTNGRFLAVPANGRKSCSMYAIIDTQDRSDVFCQVSKANVYNWLATADEDC